MKRRKLAPHPAPDRPAAPAATANAPTDTAPSAAARPADPPKPHQATVEEAVDAWRNEGDPN